MKQVLRVYLILVLGAMVFSLNAYLTFHYFAAHAHHHDHEEQPSHAHDGEESCPVCEFDFAAFLPTKSFIIEDHAPFSCDSLKEALLEFIPRFRADLPDLRGPPVG